MRFVYGRQDMRSADRAQENCFLFANGLGGYASLSMAYSVTRCDQGLLIASKTAPNVRCMLVHRMREQLESGGKKRFLSTQQFAGRRAAEDGYRLISSFVLDGAAQWTYSVQGIQIVRTMGMAYGANACALVYEIENRTARPCRLTLSPMVTLLPKGEARKEKTALSFDGTCIAGGGQAVYVRTNGRTAAAPVRWERLAYPDDAKDGREARGLCGGCMEISLTVGAGESARLDVVLSDTPDAPAAEMMIREQRGRTASLMTLCGLRDPAARQLAAAADVYISRKDTTGGETILAGYPFFGDWGRDTMIALPGLTLSTGRYDAARSILRTFLAYEKDGLVPNLFPEGDTKPMYNTVDAALLLINAVYLTYLYTKDAGFVREAFPVMERIIEGYRAGTRHGIGMDADGLIRAGQGFDQVTWMDVCIDGILPTPRHGKPVEINAYWYSALRVMQTLAPVAGGSGNGYGALADRVRKSFAAAFWMEERGYLRDVVSGTQADEQLRPNQIWALTMPFTMLEPRMERSVVDAVYARLYTPCGLRTLSPDDAQYHPTYGGVQRERDMAYHQGTAWVFPLGAYYTAYLKTHGMSAQAAKTVRAQLAAMEPMLREGCIGQLPEIYDGECPGESKGCFAQAWSVGEMLRVYELLERIESGKEGIAG